MNLYPNKKKSLKQKNLLRISWYTSGVIFLKFLKIVLGDETTPLARYSYKLSSSISKLWFNEIIDFRLEPKVFHLHLACKITAFDPTYLN